MIMEKMYAKTELAKVIVRGREICQVPCTKFYLDKEMTIWSHTGYRCKVDVGSVIIWENQRYIIASVES